MSGSFLIAASTYAYRQLIDWNSAIKRGKTIEGESFD
jgi:hypothetical protein